MHDVTNRTRLASGGGGVVILNDSSLADIGPEFIPATGTGLVPNAIQFRC